MLHKDKESTKLKVTAKEQPSFPMKKKVFLHAILLSHGNSKSKDSSNYFLALNYYIAALLRGIYK
jgi:hypothetical protein